MAVPQIFLHVLTSSIGTRPPYQPRSPPVPNLTSYINDKETGDPLTCTSSNPLPSTSKYVVCNCPPHQLTKPRFFPQTAYPVCKERWPSLRCPFLFPFLSYKSTHPRSWFTPFCLLASSDVLHLWHNHSLPSCWCFSSPERGSSKIIFPPKMFVVTFRRQYFFLFYG